MTPHLLERAASEGAPLIDGETVTFVWPGDEAPQLIGDFNLWGYQSRIDLTETEPGVWTHSLTLPRDAYIEYAYWTPDGRIRDPFNPRLIADGVGAANHYFDMPEAEHTPLVTRRRSVPAGRVTRHTVSGGFAIVGEKRPVYLYQPPVDEPCPLVFVLDGKDYFERARIATIVDNLIAQKRIRPIALAGVQHGGDARFVEYMCSDATIAFLVRDVLALAKEQLNLMDADVVPGAYGILGASMGGLMALYAGLRLPEVFGRVLSQSGAFGFDVRGKLTVIHDLARLYERRPLRVWMDVGRFEWLLEANRRMHDLLESRGYPVSYREFNGGHNYTCWRDDVGRGLEALYGL